MKDEYYHSWLRASVIYELAYQWVLWPFFILVASQSQDGCCSSKHQV